MDIPATYGGQRSRGGQIAWVAVAMAQSCAAAGGVVSMTTICARFLYYREQQTSDEAGDHNGKPANGARGRQTGGGKCPVSGPSRSNIQLGSTVYDMLIKAEMRH
jgi:hypothetical protein